MRAYPGVMTETSGRDRADRCPGVFSTHDAADGALARIRLPGGELTPEQVQALAVGTAQFGDGHLELTVRGNVQIRGITDVDGLAEIIVDAGLAPTSSHDRARNIEVSALSGRLGGVADVRHLARDLDAAMSDDDSLAGLSGRFLFGFDDGRGDVVARGPDVCARAHPGGGADILVGGTVIGSVADLTAVVPVMLDVARRVVDTGRAWRIADLDAAALEALRVASAHELDAGLPEPTQPVPSGPSPIVGWFDTDNGDVLLGAVVELGRLPARTAEFLAAVGAPIIITPDREILLADLGEGVAETVVRVLAPMGLIFDASSPWAQLSCCVGAPGCGNALAPVRDDLLARVGSGEPITAREHWVGCSRGCGSPAGSHVRVQAVGDGYERRVRA